MIVIKGLNYLLKGLESDADMFEFLSAEMGTSSAVPVSKMNGNQSRQS